MDRWEELSKAASRHKLEVLGAFHPGPEDKAPQGCQTLVLLGPGAGFWAAVSGAPEFEDDQPDPMDRWSVRVLTGLGHSLGAEAIFPFGGPPFQPFYSWAMRTGRIWSSPIMLAVHDRHGLFVSFRGALAFSERLTIPSTPNEAPCTDCAEPCLSTCPVGALSRDGYDVETCREYLSSEAGRDCMTNGCAARRACPVGQGLRDPAQSGYHMSIFHKG